ncbi:heme biosynthesis protein HemY [Mesorhizobium sp. M2A.F.Ca.ET.037.01.1.1]|uniref:heme biosynthesis protein HemY n=3 Tax=Mesorhizobium TaxID=68287 RepID=UPI000F75BCB0|nr:MULTISPECIES: heme biosynthesis protein HemY [unclassified Mesorhizobium]RUX99659.1 heme biosynthesis protein HemY [Mesorhizobium sp. M2A.F.Ca.ET.040.01.1.1]AZO35773.1 heme biosynthesis protein HemY [Mesorhizobium sp. M2A.F.Ca.ET.046.03.2.1]RUX18993.1 heme biosynthesis protein HemY [Mesorhizobium sp. M2A.F.Ca.ET.037.01.1.1]RWA84817.1 MAG: heme biosynthesis protein HemY [Mesorhizobium sp.]RWB43981.1 MAG: heme biosynthesis protein HemY [Mesorhizobium sp.]
MIRLLVFLAVVFALGLGFAWLADRPGEMLVTFNGYQYQVTLMVAAVAIAGVVAAVMIVWWLIKSLWNSPYTISRYFRVRRRDRGYQALSTGMIAAGAGDGALARKKTKEAAKLISADQEPLINLLDAQASLLEGDHEGAREKFERMLDDPEMRLLGLRGLYLEAERLGDRNAARHYAGRAAAVAPQLAWAAESTLEELTERGDWDGALKLVEAQKSTRQIERDAANRRRAVLLTAKAQALVDSDPNAARTAALEANKLAPDFAPAAVIAADLVIRQNDVRKGSKILEAAWKAEPHPDIAELYTHARPGDAVLDRLNRAKKLQELKKNHAESSMAVARAALDAQDFATARREAEAAIRMDRREGAYLLLADIEEAETGDQGKVRQLLSKAVRAPRDPAWVADGVISERWAPVSPVTGKLDAFTWRAPMERLGQLIDSETDAAVPAIAAAPPAEPAEKAIDIVADAPAEKPAPANGGEKDAAVTEDVSEAQTARRGSELPPLPDDPGVAPEEEAEKSPRRFRLF